MLPFCDRVVRIARKGISPVWSRRFPIARVPNTIGEHLRKRRFLLGLHQEEAALKLGVSERTLSLWECDEVYPTWGQQPKIVAYLGYDPFTDPALGRPLGNETQVVAPLSPNQPFSMGEEVRKRRLELRKNKSQCAKELGVSIKTLWSLETNRRKPSRRVSTRVKEILGLSLNGNTAIEGARITSNSYTPQQRR